MSKLLQDPKIEALVEKEVAKAVKAERKRCLDVVKEQVAINKEREDKSVKRVVSDVLKSTTAEIKDPSPI